MATDRGRKSSLFSLDKGQKSHSLSPRLRFRSDGHSSSKDSPLTAAPPDPHAQDGLLRTVTGELITVQVNPALPVKAIVGLFSSMLKIINPLEYELIYYPSNTMEQPANAPEAGTISKKRDLGKLKSSSEDLLEAGDGSGCSSTTLSRQWQHRQREMKSLDKKWVKHSSFIPPEGVRRLDRDESLKDQDYVHEKHILQLIPCRRSSFSAEGGGEEALSPDQKDYLECVEQFPTGAWPCDYWKASKIAALHACVLHGSAKGKHKPSKKTIQGWVKDCLPPEYRKDKMALSESMTHFHTFSEKSPAECKRLYIVNCKNLVTYRARFFVVKVPSAHLKKVVPGVIAVSPTSVVHLHGNTRQVHQTWPLDDVISFASSETVFQMTLKDGSLFSLMTLEAPKIEEAVQYYQQKLKRMKEDEPHPDIDPYSCTPNRISGGFEEKPPAYDNVMKPRDSAPERPAVEMEDANYAAPSFNGPSSTAPTHPPPDYAVYYAAPKFDGPQPLAPSHPTADYGTHDNELPPPPAQEEMNAATDAIYGAVNKPRRDPSGSSSVAASWEAGYDDEEEGEDFPPPPPLVKTEESLQIYDYGIGQVEPGNTYVPEWTLPLPPRTQLTVMSDGIEDVYAEVASPQMADSAPPRRRDDVLPPPPPTSKPPVPKSIFLPSGTGSQRKCHSTSVSGPVTVVSGDDSDGTYSYVSSAPAMQQMKLANRPQHDLPSPVAEPSPNTAKRGPPPSVASKPAVRSSPKPSPKLKKGPNVPLRADSLTNNPSHSAAMPSGQQSVNLSINPSSDGSAGGNITINLSLSLSPNGDAIAMPVTMASTSPPAPASSTADDSNLTSGGYMKLNAVLKEMNSS